MTFFNKAKAKNANPLSIAKTSVLLASLLLSFSALPAPSQAGEAWLVRGMPLTHYHTNSYGRIVYGAPHRVYYARHYVHYRRRFGIGLFGRNPRSGFFSSCAGTYGVPIC